MELSGKYCRATSRMEVRSARFIAIINLRSQMEVGLLSWATSNSLETGENTLSSTLAMHSTAFSVRLLGC